jgi:hypothetical protein
MNVQIAVIQPIQLTVYRISKEAEFECCLALRPQHWTLINSYISEVFTTLQRKDAWVQVFCLRLSVIRSCYHTLPVQISDARLQFHTVFESRTDGLTVLNLIGLSFRSTVHWPLLFCQWSDYLPLLSSIFHVAEGSGTELWRLGPWPRIRQYSDVRAGLGFLFLPLVCLVSPCYAL